MSDNPNDYEVIYCVDCGVLTIISDEQHPDPFDDDGCCANCGVDALFHGRMVLDAKATNGATP